MLFEEIVQFKNVELSWKTPNKDSAGLFDVERAILERVGAGALEGDQRPSDRKEAGGFSFGSKLHVLLH